MKNLLVSFIILTFTMVGCNDRHYSNYSNKTQTQKKVQASLLSFEDFDLETVVAVVKENKVSGAEQLEDFINGNNGVNNVDTDKDGNIDYIRVIEGKDGQAITLDFSAKPSSGEEVTVASLRFTQNTISNEMVVEGAYPNYVDGYNNHYYSYHTPHYGMTTGEALFLMWLMTPNRAMYMRPMPVYQSRPVYNRSQLQTTRATTRTTTKVSPIKNVQRPNNYNIKSAQKTQSHLKKQKVSQFKKRDANKVKSKATGWGAKSNTTKPTTKKSSGWGRTSPSRSRSWGGSRGFGGGRRRSSVQYKYNISNFTNGIDIVKKLNAVNWNWKDGSNNPSVGFIAEDVAKIMPDLVYMKNGKIEGINYDLIVVPLVNAIKDQQEQIEQLTSELRQVKINNICNQ